MVSAAVNSNTMREIFQYLKHQIGKPFLVIIWLTITWLVGDDPKPPKNKKKTRMEDLE